VSVTTTNLIMSYDSAVAGEKFRIIFILQRVIDHRCFATLLRNIFKALKMKIRFRTSLLQPLPFEKGRGLR
jgi:hypothetical protein